MKQTATERMKEIERALAALPAGYISKKSINGKYRYYLQWIENGKLKSKYIKASEYEMVSGQVEKRRLLLAELKELKVDPEIVREEKLKRKRQRSLSGITGTVMSEDKVVATVKNGDISSSDGRLLSLYLKRTRDVEGWLASRAIDESRTNSRLLKKALRLHTADNAQTALAVNAANLTDRYWFRPDGSTAMYKDVLFHENHFDTLALRGDPDGFSHKPSRTPELTNTGSFEKCWRLIDGEWWIYKSGNQNEYFSELFISRLGEKLGLDMVHYEMDDGYIRAKNFVSGRGVNFEPISSIMGDNDDFGDCFRAIADISSELAMQYLQIVWMDTICYNMDRHTENFGFLRDVRTGEIVSMAPNYDNNIALISRGYPADVSRKHDGLIRFFKEFLENNPDAALMFKEMFFPVITAEIIHECISDIPLECDEEYLESFILNGQRIVSEFIRRYDTHMLQEVEESFDLKR